MRYNGIVGNKPIQITFFATIEIPWDIELPYEKPLAQYGLGHSNSLFSGCIASQYDAMVQLCTAVNAVTSATAATVSTALQKVVMGALNMPEIDPNFLKIIFLTSGQISIAIAIPPSIADKFPTQSQLETQFYQVARTTAFADAVSSFVGLKIVSQCESGWWGADCSSQCTSPNCVTGVSCNAATGVVTSCILCKTGYWGSTTCNNLCTSAHCVTDYTSCELYQGSVVSCTVCNDGWWGNLQQPMHLAKLQNWIRQL